MASGNRVTAVTRQLWSMLFYFVQLARSAPTKVQYLPPMPLKRFIERRSNGTDPTPEIFLDQMENPSEVFSVLLIIGGDIIQKAIAQLAGGKITLVSFSFGWVAYAFNALMSAFGDGQLMPDPDYPAVVITASSGIKKTNYSWVLGRLIRDLEFEVAKHFKTWIEQVEEDGKIIDKLVSENDSGMLITVFEAGENTGVQQWDKCWALFFIVLPTQLVIAAVPVITKRNWSILFLTVVGTVLAIVTGSLREWRLQKYSCRKKTSDTYILTRGNGHSHVFVIGPGPNSGLYLDDLAGAARKADFRTRVSSVILAILWLAFLITAGGLKTDTWFLLAVGAIGMAQNILVAGLPRKPDAIGIPLRQTMPTFGRRKMNKNRPKVMDVLFEIEAELPKIGLAIRREYFPDYALREREIERWDKAEARQKEIKQWKEKAKGAVKSDPRRRKGHNGRTVFELNSPPAIKSFSNEGLEECSSR
ncbi:uncharacterized protein TrAtP1_009433 [Trichoderma atroviride]|uniref:uncharacterized protein n=1 Tax=Hypocrea atroviridis TaxID=63577 RepID=UPI0033323B47|nr:hypothetical protein TrAtP1_009433 [Trichoderma atroviride]